MVAGFFLTAGKSASEITVLAAATVTAAGVIFRFVRKWTKVAIAFFLRIEKALVNVEQQLYPNGGSSLRDAVNRIQAALDVKNIPSAGKAGDQGRAANSQPPH